MAGFMSPNMSHMLQHTATNSARDSPARRSLPSGPCNYRDAAFGPCGCDQFWDKSSAELHDDIKELPNGNRSTWCVCQHHACFHLRASRAPETPLFTPAPPLLSIQANGIVHGQSQTGAQREQPANILQSYGHDLFIDGPTVGSGQSGPLQSGATQRLFPQGPSPANGSDHAGHSRNDPSQASTSDLPRIPSVCRISYEQPQAADNAARCDMNQSRQTTAGLGLSMIRLDGVGSHNIRPSPTPAISNNAFVARGPQRCISEPDLPSTRANSIANEATRVTSPMRHGLESIDGFNRNLQLDVPGDTIPNTYDPNEYIQSATEVATPSMANTPDLGNADQAVREARDFIDTLGRTIRDSGTSPGQAASAISAPPANSPAASQEQLQHVLRTASPQVLQKLVSYLAPLHNLLNSMPNVANTMRDHGGRLEMLENGSFNYVNPEDFNHTLGIYDDRISSLEYRLDEREKHERAMDADEASPSFSRRHVAASFGSVNSLQSTTSSALILAAMDRKETAMEFIQIKDRLDVLEAAALPTTLQPWEIEVVLIPWGRDLRGIWFNHDEPMHDISKTITQDSEEWTQAQKLNPSQGIQSPQSRAHARARQSDSSPYSGTNGASTESAFGDNESGWSSQAISDWASGSSDDWLVPKACGAHNFVYKRLQSRGFVRNVALKSASAKDFQSTLSNAFDELMEHFSYTAQDGDDVVAAHPGLRASFIPLRKVHKESRLRFLTPAEMTSSALWSAQFLAAGVIMRVSGGKKRLYVTQRESYMQRSDDLGSTWTWQELRQLPRYQTDQDSQMEGNDEHCQPQVPEADAKEACWQYVETYDAPPASIHSSFGSHQSVELSMRPADRSWRRSITPSSILKNKIVQLISPLSEFHPRPMQSRQRTVSASVIEQQQPGPSKRRFDSSPVKHTSASQPTSRTPSVSISRLKRRRTTNAPSVLRDEAASTEVQVIMCNHTPRWSREPPSPFYSSQPVLRRSNSDVASRPSQRSVAVVGKSTPFAYATPHSGPVTGGPGFDAYDNGGDTEPDDDDNDDDDGEQSWRGVTDGDDDAASSSGSSNPDREEDANFGASFSGDDSGFGTESASDDGEQSDFDVDRNRRHHTTTDDDEEDGDVFDTMLDVLEH